MNARNLLSRLQGLTEEELDLEVFGGRQEDGTYTAVETVTVCESIDGCTAIFLDDVPVESSETQSADGDA